MTRAGSLQENRIFRGRSYLESCSHWLDPGCMTWDTTLSPPKTFEKKMEKHKPPLARIVTRSPVIVE
jgi:hypothetical protein